MKKVIFFVITAMVVVIMLSSCQKEETNLVLNVEEIKLQLSSTPTPTKETVQNFLSGNKLKSGLENQVLVQIFPLDYSFYSVTNDYAVKFYVYYEIGQNGKREKLLTLEEEFLIVNGVLDVNSRKLINYQIGCNLSRYFNFRNNDNIQQITYFFRFNDGRQFAYYGELYSSAVKLPPIAGGQWQLEVEYNDGDLIQKFGTKLINYYSESNLIELNIQIKKENIVSILKMNKSFLKNAYLIQLSGVDMESGEWRYMTYPVLYDLNLPNLISFNAFFVIKDVTICSLNGCWYYELGLGYVEGDKIIYYLQ